MPLPLVRRGPGVDRNVTSGIDDGELASLDAVKRVFREQPVEHLLSGEALPQQLEPARAIAAVHRRLRRDHADARLRPRHMVAHAEHARGDGHAEITGLRIERHDRKRGGRGSGSERDGEEYEDGLHMGSLRSSASLRNWRTIFTYSAGSVR